MTENSPSRAKLNSDRRLAAMIRNAGPDSREVRILERELTDLGLGTLASLDHKGLLFREIRERCNISLPSPPQEFRGDSRRLFYLAAATTVPRFIHRYIVEGEWDPQHGASLNTMLVRSCMYSFANEYRVWLREQDRNQSLSLAAGLEVAADELDESSSRLSVAASHETVDPQQTVVARIQIQKMLQSVDPVVAAMLLMTANGYSQSEIGKQLGMSVDAVSSALRRARAQLQETPHARGAAAGSTAGNYEAMALFWTQLHEWGIEDYGAASTVLKIIHQTRDSFESDARPALRRPVNGLNWNQLDLMLVGPPANTELAESSKWKADSARVCRELFARIAQAHPSFARPAGRRKGVLRDLQMLYQCLRLVTAIERRS